MIFTVFQYHVPRNIVNAINEHGFEKAGEMFDEVKIQRDVKFDGGRFWQSWMLNHYTRVAHIEANNLDEVFRVGNIGPAEQVHLLADRFHSVSVGDVIQDHETGSFWIVDMDGFSEIHIPEDFDAFAEVA